MDTKQMILLEYLIDNYINFKHAEKKQLVFKMNENLFTGDFLKKSDDSSKQARYVDHFIIDEKFEYDIEYEQNKNIFSWDLTNMETLFNNEFIRTIYPSEDSNRAHSKVLKELSSNTNVAYRFLKKAVDFVSSIDPDEYLNENYDFLFVIYNLQKFGSENILDYYLVNKHVELEVVSLVSKEDSKWLY